MEYFTINFIVIHCIATTYLLPYFIRKYSTKLASKLEKRIIPDLYENEMIEYQVQANLLKGIERVGGMLFLTNEKMIFKSHKFNFQAGQTNVEYDQIADFTKNKSSKTIDKGLIITTTDGTKLDFIMNDREQVIDILNLKVLTEKASTV